MKAIPQILVFTFFSFFNISSIYSQIVSHHSISYQNIADPYDYREHYDTVFISTKKYVLYPEDYSGLLIPTHNDIVKSI